MKEHTSLLPGGGEVPRSGDEGAAAHSACRAPLTSLVGPLRALRAFPLPRRGEGRPGLTLIEAAVTVAVVAIVAIPASRMWLSMAQANVATDRQTKALVLAQLVLESKVRVVPYDEQQAGMGHDADGDLDWTLTLTPVATGLRRAEVVVTDPADTSPVLRLAALTAKEN